MAEAKLAATKMPKSTNRAQTLIAVVLLLIGVASLPVWFFWRQARRESMRAAALPVTVSRAAPIIEAIGRYERRHGKPPPSLGDLIPRYLRQLPDAGPVAENGWHYSAEESPLTGGWSLVVRVRDEYSPNVLGFGVRFVYHPSGAYRRLAHGGVLRPFGKWGYYVE